MNFSDCENKDIVVLGGGLGFVEVKDLIDDINRIKNEKYKIRAILDDSIDLQGKEIKGVRVCGPLSSIKDYPEAMFFLAIGTRRTRKKRREIIEKLGIEKRKYITLIHPYAKVYSDVHVGYGSIIHFGCVVGENAYLGNFSYLAYDSIVGMNSVVSDYAMLSSRTTVLNSVQIGECACIGANACIGDNVVLGEGAVVGMGTVLSKNVKENELVIGNPARNMGVADDWE